MTKKNSFGPKRQERRWPTNGVVPGEDPACLP